MQQKEHFQSISHNVSDVHVKNCIVYKNSYKNLPDTGRQFVKKKIEKEILHFNKKCAGSFKEYH